MSDNRLAKVDVTRGSGGGRFAGRVSAMLAAATTAYLLLSLGAAASARAQGLVPTCGGQTATIIGTTGPDVLRGTPGDDVIFAGRGTDVVYGGGGNDVICGGGGADRLFGGEGNDRLWGGVGHDYIAGGNGNDTILGGAGNDTALGQAGNDIFRGGAGQRDACRGGTGTDREAGCEARSKVRPLDPVPFPVKNDFVRRSVFLVNEERKAGGQQKLWRGVLHQHTATIALQVLVGRGGFDDPNVTSLQRELGEVVPMLALGDGGSLLFTRVCGESRLGAETNRTLAQLRNLDEANNNVLGNPAFDRIGAASVRVDGCLIAALYAGGPLVR